MVEMQKTKAGAEATQKYLHIAEIKEDTIVLKDGTLRAVIAVSSTNFALKSEDEQNAIVAAYQGFLNSLNFPIQILVQSRILDISGYLDKLRNLATGQTNELLRIQMSEYIEYVGKLVEFANIMSKTFYVIVPYSAGQTQEESFLGRLSGFFNPVKSITVHQEGFEKAKAKLLERLQNVVSELSGMGMRTVALKTAELVELMYNSYNFEMASPLQAEALEGIDING